MRVQVSCIDFTSQAAVSECRVTCRVFVAPRFASAHALPEDGGSRGVPAILYASDQSPGGDDDGEPVEIIKVALDRAIELPAQSAVTGSTGRLLFEFDVAAGYARITAVHGANQHFHDVAALVQLRAGADGLTGQSQPILSTNSSDAPTGNVTLERITVMDFAKTIVGHTTQTTTRLWFQLHGSHPDGRRCECEIDRLGPDGHALADTPLQTLPVSFDLQAAKTRLIDVVGLTPGQRYGYRLLLRPARGPIQPRSGRLLCEGMFSTVPSDERELTVLFGSCHKPLDTGFFDPASDLRQWRRIAAGSDGDLLLLMGDQVYGDAVPEPSGGNRWFDGYVRRYNAFWAFQPMRQALARHPTYMTLDDHEVADGWGVADYPAERIDDAKLAFRVFQLAHSPSGATGSVHYHFRRGPVAFFVMDARTARGDDDEFPIFGRRQWEDLKAWAASSEARDADVIVFVSPVPVAIMPVEKLRDIAESIATAGGATAGALAGAAVGFAVGGPAGALAGAEIGLIAGGAGASIAYDQLEAEALLKHGVKEMWAFEPNQRELVRLLDLLFALSNDSRPDGRPGDRPRAVIILSGDAHFGLAHTIASNHAGGVRDHRTNPQMMQFMSSAIGRPPQDKPEMLALFEDVNVAPPDLDSVAADLIGLASGTTTKFVLDDHRGAHYRAATHGAVFQRNYGRLRLQRVGNARRYRFEAIVEGESHSLVQLFEVDLDRRPVTWRSLKDEVLTAQGRPTLLRVHEVGSAFGPPSDRLDVEVVVQLDSQPNRSFGFQLRRNTDATVHAGMLNALRTALNCDGRVRLDYRRTGIRNGQVTRVVSLN